MSEELRLANIAFLDRTINEWFDGKIISIFNVTQALSNRQGFTEPQTINVDIDNKGNFVSDRANFLLGATVTLSQETETIKADGSFYVSKFRQQRMRVTEIRYEPGVATLVCSTVNRVELSRLYPSLSWEILDWPDIYAPHSGYTIPEVSGNDVLAPCVYLGEHGTGTLRRWRYGVCRVRDGQFITGDLIFRSQQAVGIWSEDDSAFIDANNQILAYALVVPVADYNVYVLDFLLDQTQYGAGDPHPIACTVTTDAQDRNAAREIRRLVTYAGIPVDPLTFDPAIAYCDANHLYIDYTYKDKRRVDVLVAELLVIARASMTIDANGYAVLIQDTVKDLSSVTIYDERKGDPVESSNMAQAELPGYVYIQYAPWNFTAGGDVFTRSGYRGNLGRTIENGTAGTARLRDFDMIRDFVTADNVLSYMAAKASVPDRMNAIVEPPDNKYHELGDVIGIKDSALYDRTKYWRIIGLNTVANQQELELEIYDHSVHTYTPGNEIPALDPTTLSEAVLPMYLFARATSPDVYAIGSGQGSATQIVWFQELLASYGQILSDPLGNYFDAWVNSIFRVSFTAQVNPNASLNDGLYFQMQRDGVWYGSALGPYETYEQGNRYGPFDASLFWGATEVGTGGKGRYTLWCWCDGGSSNVDISFSTLEVQLAR